jgi:hypothetical protein
MTYASCGYPPSKSDLEEIAASAQTATEGAALARAVAATAKRIVEIRKTGHFADARRLASEAAEELVAPLPEFEKPPRDFPDDPRALAALVRGDDVSDDPDSPQQLAARVPRQ